MLREDRSGAAPPADMAPAGAAAGMADTAAALQPGAGGGGAGLAALPEGDTVDGRAGNGESPAVALEECVLQNSRQARWLTIVLNRAQTVSWLHNDNALNYHALLECRPCQHATNYFSACLARFVIHRAPLEKHHVPWITRQADVYACTKHCWVEPWTSLGASAPARRARPPQQQETAMDREDIMFDCLGSLPGVCVCPIHGSCARAMQFYRWHGELEAARTAEAEGKFREYAAALGGHLATNDALLSLVHLLWDTD